MSVWWLFLKEREGLAEALFDPAYEQTDQMRRLGWELTWDSAPCEVQAYRYADEFHSCYQKHMTCVGCGMTTSLLIRCVGQRFRGYLDRWIVFNGYLCESCIAETDSFKVRLTNDVRRLFEPKE